MPILEVPPIEVMLVVHRGGMIPILEVPILEVPILVVPPPIEEVLMIDRRGGRIIPILEVPPHLVVEVPTLEVVEVPSLEVMGRGGKMKHLSDEIKKQ